jgi:hypothetical protein
VDWFAIDVFEHQIIRAHVVNLANVRMIQSSDGVSLFLESVAVIGFQALDGHNPVEPGIARLVDFAHAAGPDES